MATEHMIVPVCGTCGREIDHDQRGWRHVTPTGLEAITVPIPGAPDLTRTTERLDLGIDPNRPRAGHRESGWPWSLTR